MYYSDLACNLHSSRFAHFPHSRCQEQSIQRCWLCIIQLRFRERQELGLTFNHNCFTQVTTVPAWINNTHPSVNIHLVVWLSLLIACLIYIPIGWMGAAAFAMDSNATILNILSSDRPNIVALISTYIFPLGEFPHVHLQGPFVTLRYFYYSGAYYICSSLCYSCAV